MPTERMHKFDNLILRKLATELGHLYPDRIFSLTQVHVSKDLSFAKVWVSASIEPEQLVKSFNAHAGDLRKILSKEVVARRVPKLLFVVDLTEEKAIRIDQLLDQINSKDQK